MVNASGGFTPNFYDSYQQFKAYAQNLRPLPVFEPAVLGVDQIIYGMSGQPDPNAQFPWLTSGQAPPPIPNNIDVPATGKNNFFLNVGQYPVWNSTLPFMLWNTDDPYAHLVNQMIGSGSMAPQTLGNYFNT